MINKKLLTFYIPVLFYSFINIIQISPSVIIKQLTKDFNTNLNFIGILSSVYFIIYSIIQIPSGILVDYLGPRKVLILSTFLCFCGLFIFSISKVLTFLIFSEFLIGLGSGLVIVSIMKIIKIFLPLEKFSFFLGITVSLGMIGSILGQLSISILINYLN